MKWKDCSCMPKSEAVLLESSLPRPSPLIALGRQNPLSGSRVGSLEIGPVGAGGMGEVYRARDTRLDRDVAIKVLPAAFTAESRPARRFEREARILASLNHPNIAAIYGIEDSATRRR